MTGAILCCGCGLIDMIPVDAADGGRAYRPFGGGSLCNVARALGRLGLPAEFAGGLSSDFFGDELVAGLVASGVGTRFVQRLDAPTTLGFVSLDRDEPSYAFYDIGAADRIWTDPPLPAALDGVGALHFGDIALIREPAAAAFERLFDQEAAGRRVVSLDPNIRPSLVHDEPAYRARLDRMLARADLIKISAADLEWLRPGMSHDDVAAAWRGNGASVGGDHPRRRRRRRLVRRRARRGALDPDRDRRHGRRRRQFHGRPARVPARARRAHPRRSRLAFGRDAAGGARPRPARRQHDLCPPRRRSPVAARTTRLNTFS